MTTPDHLYRWLGRLALVAMVAYTCALLAIDVLGSAEQVRPYVADIEGPVAFYGVNTTISAFLLWSVALLFAVCLAISKGEDWPPQRRAFYISQVLLFAFLGFDDRFMLHDGLGTVWGERLYWVSLGSLQLLLLGGLGRSTLVGRARTALLVAAVCFAMTIGIDQFGRIQGLPGRLAAEDLFKTWSGVMLLVYAWTVMVTDLDRLRTREPRRLAAHR